MGEGRIGRIQDLYRTYKASLQSIYKAFRRHERSYTGHIQEIYKTYTGNLQGFYSGFIQGIYRAYIGQI